MPIRTYTTYYSNTCRYRKIRRQTNLWSEDSLRTGQFAEMFTENMWWQLGSANRTKIMLKFSSQQTDKSANSLTAIWFVCKSSHYHYICHDKNGSQCRVFQQWGISVDAAIFTTAQRVATRTISHESVDVRRRLRFRRQPVLRNFTGCVSSNDFRLSSAALWGNVRGVVEMKKEEEHGPRVVESDGIKQPRIVAVRANEHVVTGVAHDCHKLRLQITHLHYNDHMK